MNTESRLFKIDVNSIKNEDQDVKTSPFLDTPNSPSNKEFPLSSRENDTDTPTVKDNVFLGSSYTSESKRIHPRSEVGHSPKSPKNKIMLMYNISKKASHQNESIDTFKKHYMNDHSSQEENNSFDSIASRNSHGATLSQPRKSSPPISETSAPLKRSRSFSEPLPPVKSESRKSRASMLIEPSFYNNTSIEEILEFIFNNKLKLNIDIGEYAFIFRKNLIITYEILCKQTPHNIDKLGLPLALETEIKNLIANKNMKKIKSMKDLNSEIKQKLKESWAEIRNETSKLDLFINTFYKNLCSIGGKKMEEIIKPINIKKQVNKIISTISILLNFIDGDINTHEINRLALIHMLHLPAGNAGGNVVDIEKFYDMFAKALADTICKVLDPDVDSIYYASSINNIKDGWYILTKTFGELIYQEYDYIKKGKMFQVYLRKSKNSKWSKHYCNISHDKIVFSTFPKFDKQKTIPIENIILLEKMDTDDNRIVKQTDWCFKLGCKDIDYYVCTDIKDSLDEIHEMIKTRLEIFEF